MKINIGCGKDKRIGWRNTDKERDWFKIDYKKGSIDAILANHIVMYIRPEDKLFKKWYRWLKKGGTVHIETQDFNKIKDLNTLYGQGKNAGHRWVWTPKSLSKELQGVGFKTISMPGILHGKPERDFIICGIK
jgi:predicted SAM-dependent methyltransferase